MRARLVHELSTGYYVEPSRMTLEEWMVDHWLPIAKTRVKPTTFRAAYRSSTRHHIAPHLGGVQLGKLTPQMLMRLYHQLLDDGRVKREGGLSPATVKGIHALLHNALSDAGPPVLTYVDLDDSGLT